MLQFVKLKTDNFKSIIIMNILLIDHERKFQIKISHHICIEISVRFIEIIDLLHLNNMHRFISTMSDMLLS